MLKGFTSILVIVLLSGSITLANAQPPIVRAPASQPVIVDADNNTFCCPDLYIVNANQRVLIKSSITSQIQQQSFVYIVKVTDSEGVTVLLSWDTSKLGKNERLDLTQSWTPDKAGHYIAEIFVWDSLKNPLVLSPVRSVDVAVTAEQAPSNVKCDGKLVPQIGYKNNTIPVLLMQTNSTATVCVTYQTLSDWASYPNKDIYPKGIAQFALGIGRNECKHYDESYYGCSYRPTPPDLFRITAIPNVLNITSATNGTNFTIMYKIYAAPNSKGFYDSSVPTDGCESYPLAVGYVATQVKASDFSPLIGIPCFATLYVVDSVRISGMDYTNIVFHHL